MASRRDQATRYEHEHKESDKACNGKIAKKANVYCSQPAGYGTDHVGIGRCKFHGGAAPNYRNKVQTLRAAAAVEQYGLPREIDPHDALLEELARTAGHVDWLRLQIANIEHSTTELPDGKSNPTPNNKGSKLVQPVGGGEGGYPDFTPNIWIRMYNDERKHLIRIAKTCIDAGIEERRVRLAESQGQIIAEVLRNVLGQLNVLDLPETPRIVRAALEQASGGPITVTAEEVAVV